VPPWVNLVEIATPFTALTALILLGRIARQDVGLTLGKPAVTCFWIAAGAAVEGAVRAGAVGASAAWVRLAGWPVPPEELTPSAVGAIELLGPVLWHECVVAPLREEVLARGITVPALERIGGPGLAVLGSAVIWAAGHGGVHTVGTLGLLAVWGMM